MTRKTSRRRTHFDPTRAARDDREKQQLRRAMKLSLQEAKNDLHIEQKHNSSTPDDLVPDKALAHQCYSRHAEALDRAQVQLRNDLFSFQATSSKIQPLIDSTFDPSSRPYEGLVEVIGELYLGVQKADKLLTTINAHAALFEDIKDSCRERPTDQNLKKLLCRTANKQLIADALVAIAVKVRSASATLGATISELTQASKEVKDQFYELVELSVVPDHEKWFIPSPSWFKAEAARPEPSSEDPNFPYYSPADYLPDSDFDRPNAEASVATPSPKPRFPSDVLASSITPPLGKITADTPYGYWFTCSDKLEVDAIVLNKVFRFVPTTSMTPGATVLKTRFHRRAKAYANGLLKKFKSRLVCQGFRQVWGKDYTETYAPTLSYPLLRVILVWALQNGLPARQYDVQTAFLLADLPEDIELYITLPSSVKVPKGHIARLCKSLYGIKQAPRLFSRKFLASLREMGWTVIPGTACVFLLKKEGKIIAMLGVFVDDCILAAPLDVANEFVTTLRKTYGMTDEGTPAFILGIGVKYNSSGSKLFLSQQAYVTEILREFGMLDAKPVPTPEVCQELSKAEALAANDEEREAVKDFPMGRLVGKLSFLSQTTRPDIQKATSTLASFLHGYGPKVVTAANRVLRYLRGTITMGILYERTAKGPRSRNGTVYYRTYFFADASFACDPDSRRSRSGGVIIQALGAVIWWSRRQSMVALSTCEAEFLAFFEMCLEAVWLRPILVIIGAQPADQPALVYQDNQATVVVTTREAISRRTKHYGMRHMWVVDQTTNGEIRPLWCPTTEMLADPLTKALARLLFQAGRLGLGVVNAPQWALLQDAPSANRAVALYSAPISTTSGPQNRGDVAGDGASSQGSADSPVPHRRSRRISRPPDRYSDEKARKLERRARQKHREATVNRLANRFSSTASQSDHRPGESESMLSTDTLVTNHVSWGPAKGYESYQVLHAKTSEGKMIPLSSPRAEALLLSVNGQPRVYEVRHVFDPWYCSGNLECRGHSEQQWLMYHYGPSVVDPCPPRTPVATEPQLLLSRSEDGCFSMSTGPSENHKHFDLIAVNDEGTMLYTQHWDRHFNKPRPLSIFIELDGSYISVNEPIDFKDYRDLRLKAEQTPSALYYLTGLPELFERLIGHHAHRGGRTFNEFASALPCQREVFAEAILIRLGHVDPVKSGIALSGIPNYCRASLKNFRLSTEFHPNGLVVVPYGYGHPQCRLGSSVEAKSEELSTTVAQTSEELTLSEFELIAINAIAVAAAEAAAVFSEALRTAFRSSDGPQRKRRRVERGPPRPPSPASPDWDSGDEL